MSETNNQENKFAINEYIEVKIKKDIAALCSDCYRALGWEIMDTSTGIDSVTLKLLRDRKIKNRVALCDLQRKCEAAFNSLEKMGRWKTKKARAVSIGIGIIGAIFMTGAVFAYMESLILECIILAIVAFIGWGITCFLYKKLLKESMKKVNPIIDRNYNIIYEACEKASQLLS